MVLIGIDPYPNDRRKWCIMVTPGVSLFFFQDSTFRSFFGVAISFIPISIIIRMPLCGDIHVLLSPVDSDIDIRKTHCFPLGT